MVKYDKLKTKAFLNLCKVFVKFVFIKCYFYIFSYLKYNLLLTSTNDTSLDSSYPPQSKCKHKTDRKGCSLRTWIVNW